MRSPHLHVVGLMGIVPVHVVGQAQQQASHELVRAGAPVSQLMGDCKADPCRGTQARSEACPVEGRP